MERSSLSRLGVGDAEGKQGTTLSPERIVRAKVRREAVSGACSGKSLGRVVKFNATEGQI